MKKVSLIVLTIIAIAIIAVAGFFAYRHFAKQPQTQQPTQTAGWKTYTGYGISFEYPSAWTYQAFNCNLEGVAFCPAKNGVTGCGQTCGMDSPESPIYFYNSPTVSKNSVQLRNNSYKDIYNHMLSTFKFATPDQTAGWKTYKSAVYDYEIKLPVGFEIAPVNVPTALPIEMGKYSNENYEFDLEIYARNQDFIVRDCLKDLSGKDIVKTKDVNGNKFYVFEERKIGTGGRMALAEGAMQSERHILHAGSCYIIQYTLIPPLNQVVSITKTEDQFKLLDQIFSTFKFTK